MILSPLNLHFLPSLSSLSFFSPLSFSSSFFFLLSFSPFLISFHLFISPYPVTLSFLLSLSLSSYTSCQSHYIIMFTESWIWYFQASYVLFEHARIRRRRRGRRHAKKRFSKRIFKFKLKFSKVRNELFFLFFHLFSFFLLISCSPISAISC